MIDINLFNPLINIDWYQKSIEIEVTEKIIYQLLSINKIDNNRQKLTVIDINLKYIDKKSLSISN